jgi:hypothetical protein
MFQVWHFYLRSLSGLIVTSALVICKGLICITDTGSESTVVFVSLEAWNPDSKEYVLIRTKHFFCAILIVAKCLMYLDS